MRTNERIENIDEARQGDGKNSDRSILAPEKGLGPLFDRVGNFAHPVGPRVSAQNIADKIHGEQQTEQANAKNEC